MEDKWGVLPIEHDDINLLAEVAMTVHHMRLRWLVTMWQIFLEQFQPDMLARVALGNGMAECLACRLQATLNVTVKTCQEYGKGPIGPRRGVSGSRTGQSRCRRVPEDSR